MAGQPKAEVELTPHIVRSLLRAQQPELAELSLRPLARGWDNTNFRLGDDFIVRLPHREVGVPLLELEQRWLPNIADLVDMPIPVPIYAGTQTDSYPWPWSITPWFEGDVATSAPLSDPVSTAKTLARFLKQLHQAAPAEAPTNPFRGCPLADRSDSFTKNLRGLNTTHDKVAIAAMFDNAAATPLADRTVWLHGDLHGRNMIVNEGELAAVIDWGDICMGDPAGDLAATYMLVPDHIEVVHQHAGATENEWKRARGWAAHFAVIYLHFGDDDPILATMGEQLITTLLAS